MIICARIGVELAGRLVGERSRGGWPGPGRWRRAAARRRRARGAGGSGALGEADQVEQLARPARPAPSGRCAQAERHLDVLGGAEDREQAERLEDEADRARRTRQLRLVERRDVDAVDEDVPGGRAVEAAEHVQQRRLAAAGAARGRRTARLRARDTRRRAARGRSPRQSRYVLGHARRARTSGSRRRPASRGAIEMWSASSARRTRRSSPAPRRSPAAAAAGPRGRGRRTPRRDRVLALGHSRRRSVSVAVRPSRIATSLRPAPRPAGRGSRRRS